MIFKRKVSEREARDLENIMKVLGEIYANKSSDEFKCKGDIRKVPMYKEIEKQISDLSTLRRFPATEAKDIKTMFLTLHRPIFPQMVKEYIAKPDERNSLFTALFTVAYRVLVGELARIFASTEATEKGLVYKPDKISRRNNMSWFIKTFNDDLDKKLDEYIKSTYTEYATFHQESDLTDAIDAGANVIIRALGIIPRIFRSARELNPISFFNAVLMRSYDNKVKKYEEVCGLYEATKQAYEEYLKIPRSDRKRAIEHRYKKNIEKYNIKMNNLKAQIDHYDSRAMEEAKDSGSSKSSEPKPADTTTTTTTTTTSGGDDDFDF